MTKRNEIENRMNKSNAAITSTDETGNNYVPAYRVSTDSKLSSLISYFLPEDCRVLSCSDYYYATAIVFICATLIFPAFIVGAIICVVKAKQQKGGQA